MAENKEHPNLDFSKKYSDAVESLLYQSLTKAVVKED